VLAHEFNSILTAIIGQSELLLADLPAESPLLGNATEISKAAGRAATLTRQRFPRLILFSFISISRKLIRFAV
jgi:signal transduction histidine kinase